MNKKEDQMKKEMKDWFQKMKKINCKVIMVKLLNKLNKKQKKKRKIYQKN